MTLGASKDDQGPTVEDYSSIGIGRKLKQIMFLPRDQQKFKLKVKADTQTRGNGLIWKP
jgi:hypothetical protein